MQLEIRELTTKEEMLDNIELMRFSYPTFTLEKYDSYLSEMIPQNDIQIIGLKLMFIINLYNKHVCLSELTKLTTRVLFS